MIPLRNTRGGLRPPSLGPSCLPAPPASPPHRAEPHALSISAAQYCRPRAEPQVFQPGNTGLPAWPARAEPQACPAGVASLPPHRAEPQVFQPWNTQFGRGGSV
jgi:hypothetical protein